MWGNNVLTGTAPTGCMADHSTFRFVRSVEFDRADRSWRSRNTSHASVQSWFEALMAAGIKRLHLDATGQLVGHTPGELPGHHSAAFANSITTPIISSTRKRSTPWSASWSVVDGPRPADNRIWTVRYQRVAELPLMRLTHPSVEQATSHLAEALQQIQVFAEENETGHWVGWFREAQELLVSTNPEVPYYPDFLPRHGLQHARLTSGAVKAFVFGGMGSWNDLAFESDPANRQATRRTDLDSREGRN